MAKKRSWAHLKKYWFKKKGKGRKRSMAKRRKRRKSTHHRRRRGGGGGHRRRSRRRHHGGGAGGRGIAAVKQDAMLMGVAAGYGFLEAKAKAEPDFFLNKLPRPVDQLGFAGGTALALYALTMVTPNKWVRLGARAVAMVAAYQIGRKGSLFTSGSEKFAISGYGDETVLEDHLMGALNAEGTQMTGVPFDDQVYQSDSLVGR